MERCSHCGAEVRPSEACRVAGEIICPTCADTHTRICARCGERIWEEENCGDEDTVLCSGCYEDHYTHCSRCGRVIAYSSARYA